MTLPEWVPTHCNNCLVYMGHDEGDWIERPDGRGSGYRCPLCGHSWQAIPPEDWDGSLLYERERELQTPPSNYGYEDVGLKFSGRKWREVLG